MIWDEDLAWLVDLSKTYRLTCGWVLVIRVDWCDPTVGRPHGLSYAMILNDEQGNRILGLDNSHAFDGARPEDPFDHEHLPGKVGQRFRYEFKSGAELFDDIFERVRVHCQRHGVPYDFEDDTDD